MSQFDLDAKITATGNDAHPDITSKFLCTPGCQTGALDCFTRVCNPTGTCPITK
jgi:lantibiotic bacteriocin